MARPKSTGETKSHQQHLLMAPSEVKAIDDWMFRNRVRSRGEAIRRLCQIGILVDSKIDEVAETATELLSDAKENIDIAIDNRRQLIPSRDADRQFSVAELHEILWDYEDRGWTWLHNIRGYHAIVVSLYNAVVNLIDSPNVDNARVRASREIADGERIIQELGEELLKESSNRYFHIWLSNLNDEERSRLDGMTEEESETYIARRQEELAHEEELDPRAFREKYGLLRFWQKPEL